MESQKSPHAITISSIYRVWHFLWSELELQRKHAETTISRPQLQSVTVFVGPQVPNYEPYDPGNEGLYEHEEISFEMRLCERDEDANQGLARVVCLELEALKAKFGTEPPFNHWQERLLQGMIDRVERGVPMQPGTNLYSARDLTRPLRMPVEVDGDMEY